MAVQVPSSSELDIAVLAEMVEVRGLRGAKLSFNFYLFNAVSMLLALKVAVVLSAVGILPLTDEAATVSRPDTVSTLRVSLDVLLDTAWS